LDKKSNAYAMLFATAVCAVLAVGLAATYNGLKDTIASNEVFDRQKNILIATGLYDPVGDAGKSRKELEALLAKYVRSEVLEIERDLVNRRSKSGGDVIEEKVRDVVDVVKTEHRIEDLDDLRRTEAGKKDAKSRREFVPFYTRVDDAGKPVAYCFPISGYGLWSTLYGFLALDADLDTVRGITFYKHAETPGLGGEVDNRSWQAQWRGKHVRGANGELVGITVKKGKVDPAVATEKRHMVDGLSGATITSNGVTNFLAKDLGTYEKYFQKLRSK
jgi:Na+-transporting NADH:ubiquinone oxidoreductase subunit C